MNNIGEQINSIINSISNKLGIAVEKLYPALKFQAKIDGFESLIWLLIGIVMIIVAIYLANKIVKWMRSEKYDEYDDAERVMLSWGGVAVLVLIG